MRYETLLLLYGQMDAIYSGISLALLSLLLLGLLANLTPSRFHRFARAGILILALFGYAGLLFISTIGGAV